MAYSLNDIVDRLKLYTLAWLLHAPNESFAGMTFAEFKAVNEAPLRLRLEITHLTLALERKKVERDDADRAARLSLKMVADAIKGTPKHGRNSPFYAALGFICDRDRKSGLVRKFKKTPEA